MEEYKEEKEPKEPKEPISLPEEDRINETYNTDIIPQVHSLVESGFPEQTVMNSEETVPEVEQKFKKMREWNELPNWVCWKLKWDKETGKYKKIPINPRTGKYASVIDPSTWTVGKEAIESYRGSKP